MNGRLMSLCLVALAFAGGCEFLQEPDPLPSSRAAAEDFMDAWESGDYHRMSELMSEPVPPERLERWLEETARQGEVTAVTVELVGDVREFSRDELGDGPPPVTPAEFAITYTSQAATRPVTFEGVLDLALAPGVDAEDGDEQWKVRWERADLWPGVEGADGFDVRYRWLKRGAILDRDGRRLAVGPAAKRRYPQGAVGGITVGHIEPSEDEKLSPPESSGRGRDDSGDASTEEAGNLSATTGASASPATAETEGDPVELEEETEDEEAPNEGWTGEEPEYPAPSAELVGASGLELALERRLAGRPTSRLAVVDGADEVVEVVGRNQGRAGRDVKTTLDVQLQGAAESAYGGTTGGAVVMDPSNGDLLAIVSSSPFNPSNYAGVAGIEPFNRALSGRYPPGSSLKVMTGAAALEEGVVKEGTKLSGPPEYRGVRNFESGAFGTLDFATAVRFSVNTAFAQIAEDLGARRLYRYAEAFGFNHAPQMPLAAATSSFPFPEDEGDIMWSSIGQAQVLATPLQMATIAATIANNGRRMEPRILMRAPKSGDRVVSRRVARTMTRLMENVVKSGTGTGAAIGGAQVAGKTGTAEVDVGGERMNHAWFIAFAPSQSPKVAVAVVSELGGVGGQVAAPLAGRILSAVLPLVR